MSNTDIPTILKPDELPVYSPKDKYWSYEPSAEKEVFYAKTGPASEESFPAITYPQLLAKAAEEKGDKVALRVERPIQALEDLPKKDGKPDIPPASLLKDWKTWTYQEYLDDTRKIAKGLMASGFVQFDSCNIYGFNSPEWSICQNAAIFAGGKPAGIYPTDTPDQIQFKMDYANGSVIAVDGQKTLNKVSPVIENLTYIKAILCWGDFEQQSLKNKNGEEVKIYSWEEFIKNGESVSDEQLDSLMATLKPSQCCCLIYTSGTTGNPKGVMLSHDAVIYEAYMAQKNMGDIATKPEEERAISYLPLSHVAGMMVDIVAPIVVAAFTPSWLSVNFARPYDLKTGSLVQRLQAIKPTLFLGVPRVWEKMAERLKVVLGQASGFKAMLARWAMNQGQSYVESMNFNHAKPKYVGVPSKSWLYLAADKLVLSKVRARLGLDKAKFYFTGAAPIQVETLKYMACFGININEVYGMSEGTGGTTWSVDNCHLWGSCGTAFSGIEVKVLNFDGGNAVEVPKAKELFAASEAEQGEICSRGRSIMIGYLANPRLGAEHVATIEKKNAEAIDKNGYLHSGDKGAMSECGFFKITGRYKEIIVTAGGENVAPVPIEDNIKRLCPFISNAVMIGDKRKFNIMLITLKLEGATGELPGTEQLVSSAFSYLKTASTTIAEAMEDDKITKEIENKIKETNKDGKVVISNASKVQKFMILPRDFSVVTDDFTATLKLKRGFVTKKFEKVVDLLYTSKEVYVKFPMEKFGDYYESEK